MNKPVYLGLLESRTLELCKILMYVFRCDYVKPKCDKKVFYGYR